MKKRIQKTILAALIIGLAACGGNAEAGDNVNYDDAMAVQDELMLQEEQLIQPGYGSFNTDSIQAIEEEDIDETDGEPEESGRMLIKTANVSFETENIGETEKRIRKRVSELDGYVGNENQYQSYGRINYSMTVNVPNSNFDKMMESIADGVKEFESRDVTVQDVTEEFIDISARIKTKKELEVRYHELLDMAKTIPDILELEDQILVLREQIESFEGRLRYLSNNVTYSSITITFYEEVEVEEEDQPNRFGEAFTRGWDGIVALLVMLTHIWPFLIIGGVAFLIVRINMKKRKIKNG